MKKSEHIIEKVFLDINTSNLKTAHFIKNNISAFLKDELFPKLELLFDDYDLPDSIVRFDRFSISLSMDELQNFEKLKYEVSKNVQEKLELHFQPTRSEIKLPNKNLGEEILEKEEIASAANQQNVFFFFLKHGYLPWYGRAEQFFEFTKTINWNKNLQYVEFLHKLKQTISTDEIVLDRFILQLSNDNIVSFLFVSCC